MRSIAFQIPKKICIGRGTLLAIAEQVGCRGESVHIIGSQSSRSACEDLKLAFSAREIDCSLDLSISREPTISMFRAALRIAKQQRPETIIGIGGGSVLDMAKLIAASVNNPQDITETFGIGLLQSRSTRLICVPTTSGTGSEVSPNALLLDEAEQLKKVVISPLLVPDATFIDPLLMTSMSSRVTASTGFDALTHCIEAYTNKFSHPAVDMYALEGIRLIATHIDQAVARPDNLDAREAMALASLYGGLCLGPVNTAGVHALAYPLGGRFRVAHGLSNALLLPYIFAFNIPACPQRHADVALALGVRPESSAEETSWRGVERIEELVCHCGLELGLRPHGIAKEAIPEISSSAMTVTRLLKNNPREITLHDAEFLYRSAYDGQSAAFLRNTIAPVADPNSKLMDRNRRGSIL